MKKVIRLTVVMAVMMLGVLLGASTGQAKGNLVKLKKNKLYTKYDVTADGKADKVKVISKTKKKNYMNTMKLQINGKVVFKHKESSGEPIVQLVFLEDNQSLISIFHRGDNDYGERLIFSYAGSKWKKLMDLNGTKVEAKYDNPEGSVTAVSGNAVTISYAVQSAMVGLSSYSMDYLYTDGKLELQTPIVDYYIYKNTKEPGDYVKGQTMTARKEMQVYDKVEEGRTVAFTIKAEDPVKFLKIQRVNGRPWYLVSVGENEGWLECGEYDYYYPPEGEEVDQLDGLSAYFRNTVFAG